MNDVQMAEEPRVLFWFRVYLAVMCLMYLGVTVIGILGLMAGQGIFALESSSEDAFMLTLMGFLFTLMGAILFAICCIPFFAPQRSWVWIYDLVIICIGMTSACFLPACIPLLIYWLKPETKAWFGRSDTSANSVSGH